MNLTGGIVSWWFRNPANHLGCIKPCKKNGINYQPQLVSRISEPSTVAPENKPFAPKWNNRLPSIHFQWLLLLVSGRVWILCNFLKELLQSCQWSKSVCCLCAVESLILRLSTTPKTPKQTSEHMFGQQTLVHTHMPQLLSVNGCEKCTLLEPAFRYLHTSWKDGYLNCSFPFSL